MIGNKSQASKRYIVEHSRTKDILIPVAEIALFLVLISAIYLFLSAFLGSRFFYGTYKFFIYLYLIVAMLSLLRARINYYKQRKNRGIYQIKVNDNEISVEDNLKKSKLKFHFNDIKKYTVINCGYSVYEAIKLETKKSKKILIYSSMKNYRKFKQQLKKYKILGKDYIYKPLGYTEENIY